MLWRENPKSSDKDTYSKTRLEFVNFELWRANQPTGGVAARLLLTVCIRFAGLFLVSNEDRKRL